MLNTYVAEIEMKSRQEKLEKAARMAWMWNQPRNEETIVKTNNTACCLAQQSNSCLVC
jgi:hypothetical protein